jgi:hypothetical protein
MGVDTYVHLRVRDRGALREALESYAVKDRKEWTDQGRAAEYDELVASGYDPRPLLRPLDDGSVSIFTGLRFGDREMEYTIRCWLESYFGDKLSRIHDDPRGVFVSPDVCEPRSRTYDGLVAELQRAGRFIDPSPPTQEEHDARERAFEEYSVAMAACEKAKADGDEEGLHRALAAAPDDVRASWAARDDMERRMSRLSDGPAMFEVTALPDAVGEDDAGVAMPAIDPAEAMAIMRRMMGLPAGAAHDGDGNPLDATPEGLSAMFASMIERSTKEMNADPLGFGRVAMLLPASVANALAATPSAQLDVQERFELADGSVIIVTSTVGEAVMEVTSVAEALATTGFDRAGVGAFPCFRESLADEAASMPTFAEAKAVLRDRVELFELRTWEERMQDKKKSVASWLDEQS